MALKNLDVEGWMFAKFLPHEASFFDFFEQHAEIIAQAAKEFNLMASSDAKFDLSDPLKFKKWEHQADKVVHDCAEALHKTFITPIEREDILRLISAMDDIIDEIEEAFDCLVVYKIEKPTAELKRLSEILLACVEKIVWISRGLRNMKHVEAIKENCRLIRSLEHEGDEALRAAIAKLFDEEESTRMVIKLKETYEKLEDAIDSCHRAANIAEGIVLNLV